MPNRVIKISSLVKEVRERGICSIEDPLPLSLDKDIRVPGAEVEEVARALKHLSEPSKLKILALLYYNGSLPVCIISYSLGLSQTLVSHHLRAMRIAGLVGYERVGKYKLYRLTSSSEKILTALLTRS